MCGLIYLAGPVDAVIAAEARGWRESAMMDLGRQGFATYSPAHAFSVGTAQSDQEAAIYARIVDINVEALRACTGVLANLQGPSFGTPVEVWLALFHYNVPVFAWGLSERSIYQHMLRVQENYAAAMEACMEWHQYNRPSEPEVPPGFRITPEVAHPNAEQMRRFQEALGHE